MLVNSLLLFVGFIVGAICGSAWMYYLRPEKHRETSDIPTFKESASTAPAATARSRPSVTDSLLHTRLTRVSQGSLDVYNNRARRLGAWAAVEQAVDTSALALRDFVEQAKIDASTKRDKTARIHTEVQELAHEIDTFTAATERDAVLAKELQMHHSQLIQAWSTAQNLVEVLAQKIGRVSDRMVEIADSADTAISVAEGGYTTLHATIDQLERSRNLMAEADERSESLMRQLDRIGSVVRFIEDIARQTNLLSLNAAIIAAQSSNSQAFAVLANEIKNLSEKTRASTHDIASQMREINKENVAVEESIRNSSDAAEAAHQLAIRAADALSSLREESLQVSRLTRAATKLTAVATVEARAFRRLPVDEYQDAAFGEAQKNLQKMQGIIKVLSQDVTDIASGESGTPAEVLSVVRNLGDCTEKGATHVLQEKRDNESLRALVQELRSMADEIMLSDAV